MMKVLILYNRKPAIIQNEMEAEYDSDATINTLKKAILEKHAVAIVEVDSRFMWVNKVLSENADIVFNISEGYNGPARESIYAAILEQLSIPYTGPDSTNLLICHNKYLSKMILSEVCDIPRNVLYIPGKTSKIDIGFPAIVKLNAEGSSIGLSSASIVYTEGDLMEQIKRISKMYMQNMIIEEYIVGHDISVAYVEGIGILGPCSIEYSSEIYDYESKTIHDDDVRICPLYGDYSELNSIAEKIVNRLDLRGYGKLDFRYRDGKYYLIEVNGQVSFHPSGEFIVCAKKDGYSFSDIVNHIIDNASKCKRSSQFSAGVADYHV